MAFDLQTIPLPTGLSLDVAVAGDPASPASLLLPGFPPPPRAARAGQLAAAFLEGTVDRARGLPGGAG